MSYDQRKYGTNFSSKGAFEQKLFKDTFVAFIMKHPVHATSYLLIVDCYLLIAGSYFQIADGQFLLAFSLSCQTCYLLQLTSCFFILASFFLLFAACPLLLASHILPLASCFLLLASLFILYTINYMSLLSLSACCLLFATCPDFYSGGGWILRD